MEINRSNADVGLELNNHQIVEHVPGDSVHDVGYHDNDAEAFRAALSTVGREIWSTSSEGRILGLALQALGDAHAHLIRVRPQIVPAEEVRIVVNNVKIALDSLNTQGKQAVDSIVDEMCSDAHLSKEEVLDKVKEYVSKLRAAVQGLLVSPDSILDGILRLVSGEIVPEWQREHVSRDILSSIKEMAELIRTNTQAVRAVNGEIQETTYGTMEQLAESCRKREDEFNELLAPLEDLRKKVEAKVQELRSDMEAKGIQAVPDSIRENLSRLGYDVEELGQRITKQKECHEEREALLSSCLAGWSSIQKAYRNLRGQLNWCIYRHEEYIKQGLPLPWGVWQSRFPAKYTDEQYYLKDVGNSDVSPQS